MKLFELIGNTPLVELEHIPVRPEVKILCKLEGQNPGGSVKDRAAFYMIREALRRGDIKKGAKLIEATSGNTGIALAMMARLLGVEMTLVMPDNSTRERVVSMEAYGAKVILTPAEKTIEYSRELAEKMASSIDQRKWMCVEADDLQVAGWGDVVMLIMVSSDSGLTSQSYVDAFAEVCGAEPDFTI